MERERWSREDVDLWHDLYFSSRHCPQKQMYARDLWTTIENLFRDNKEARAIQLDHELRFLTIGDLSVHDYCQKLKSLSDLLANVDSPVSERALVMHMLNGLCDKFYYIINVSKHRNPFPTFTVARSMLLMEEERLKKQTKKLVHQPANSSSPNILYDGQPSIDYGHQQQQSYQNNNNRNNNGRGRGRGRNSNTRGRGRYQQNWNNNSWQSQPWQQPPQYWPQQPQQQWQSQPWRNNAPAAYHVTTPATTGPGLLGSFPQQTAAPAFVSQNIQHASIPATLENAFSTMTTHQILAGTWIRVQQHISNRSLVPYVLLLIRA